MSTITQPLSLTTLLQRCQSYTNEQKRARIKKAYDLATIAHAGVFRSTGEEYIQHPLAVAHILADIHLHSDSIIAALVHDTVEDSSMELEDIDREFGSIIRDIIDGVTKFNTTTHHPSKEGLRNRTIRKIIQAMVTHPLVIIIKIADRLHNMRTLYGLSPQKQHIIAEETLEIYAPLAQYLGMQRWSDELYTLAFEYLDPDRYTEVLELFARHTGQAEKTGEALRQIVQHGTAQEASIRVIPANIHTLSREYRAWKEDFFSHAYTFYVYTDTTEHCYRTLGYIHNQWHPIQNTFHDCIATPEKNGYQALQTTVLKEGKYPVTVHIQTHIMCLRSLYGIASYYQNENIPTEQEKKFWMEQLQDWQKDSPETTEAFISTLKREVLQEQLFVFTPAGEIMDMQKGSTALDFAYAIHTDIGNTCAFAYITNTHPLTGQLTKVPKGREYTLRNGDIVEIIAENQIHPETSWLQMVVSTRARSKIRKYLATHAIIDRKQTAEIPGALEDKHDHELIQCRITASDRPGLLHDITEVFSNIHISLDSVELVTGTPQKGATFILRFASPDNADLQQIIQELHTIPYIQHIHMDIVSS